MDPSDIELQAPWYQLQLPSWELAGTLLEGTDAMRAAGETYLPRFIRESEPDYQRRLNTASLNNFYRRMARQMCGFLFADQLKIEKCGISESILNNIDNRGSDIHIFARKFALQYLTHGLHHILVDMPKLPAQAKTIHDEQKAGLRPYWLSMPAATLFNGYATQEGGADRLRQIRWCDDGYRENGLSIEAVRRIRVMLDDGKGAITYQVWEEVEKKVRRAKGAAQAAVAVLEWQKTDEGALTGISRIPLSTLYAERSAFMTSRSPLRDIAHKQVSHFQSDSDQRNILTVSRYPILVQVGTKDAVTQTGPFCSFHSPGKQSAENQDAEFYYIEPTGTGIEAGERDLDRLVAEAESLGMELIVRPSKATATEAAQDAAAETSPLQDIAQSIEDGLNQALAITAEWMGLGADKGGYVVMNKDFGITADDAKAIEAIMKARAAGDLTRSTLWEELDARGVFRTGFDKDAEESALDKEDEALMKRTLRSGLPAPDEQPPKNPADVIEET